MVRKCCVVHCLSNNREGENSRSLFRFPDSESVKYPIWLDAVGHNLNYWKRTAKILYICDLHFHKECILKTGLTMWKDGIEVTIPRKKPRLEANSVPSIFSTNKQKTILFPVNESSTLKLNSKTEQAFPSDPDLSLQQLITPKLEPLESKDWQNLLTSDQVNAHSERSDNYTKELLIEDWLALKKESKIPSNWAMCDTTVGALFAYCGETPLMATHTILVKDDMSFEIRFMGQIIQFTKLTKVCSFTEMWRIIIFVTSSRVCEWANNEMQCKTILFVPKHKSASRKCHECQLKSRLKNNRDRRRKRRAILREHKLQKI